MIAGSIHDLDGLGIIFGPVAYWKYHHLLGHNLMVGIIICSILTFFSHNRVRSFFAYFAVFHIHLVMDYLSSDQEWVIYYFWPFSLHEFENPQGWNYFSWQNLLAAGVFLAWTVWIMLKNRRTPLELIMPSLDRQIVDIFARFCIRKKT